MENGGNATGWLEPDSITGRVRPIRRQQHIAEYVLQHGSVAAKDLASLFGVSLMTIHRDLDELERQGVLRKLRGRVTAQPTSLFESNVRYRLRTARAEKEALSRFALTLIEPGQSVMLDDSTTTLPLAHLLPTKAPITVITNFGMTLSELSGIKGVNLISLGGEYMPSHDAFVGVVCEAAIASVRADILFMSTSALSACSTLHQEPEIVRIKRAMIVSSKRRVLLVDHTKLSKVALHQLASLQDFDLVVVDAAIDEAQINELKECSVPFEVVPL
jgi:DeoR/GlpR family transcriptional regulator of sugar metabolism